VSEEFEAFRLSERVVRATFKKQVSDGNYGSETAEIVLEAEAEDDEDGVAHRLLLEARRLVHAELARSPQLNVRRAVGAEFQPAPTRAVVGGPPTDYADEDPELDPPPWQR
jgi:hypothetical protein